MKMKRPPLTPAQIALVYLVVAIAWEIFSDTFVFHLTGRFGPPTLAHISEEFLVVSVTAFIIFALIRKSSITLLGKQVEIESANRFLRIISDSNKILINSGSEVEFLRRICEVIVETGGYPMAWVGLAGDDKDRKVTPLAWAGAVDGYFEAVQIRWDDSDGGAGPTGRAIKTGLPQISGDMRTDESCRNCAEEEAKRGFLSCISFPMIGNGGTFGVLTVFSDTPNAFTEVESQLLGELADDMAYGVAALRARQTAILAEETSRRLARFPEENPHPVLRAGEDGSLIYANPAAESICQNGGLLPDDLAAAVVSAYLNETSDEIVVERGGKHFSLHIVPIPKEGYVNIYGRDITERIERERSLAYRLGAEKALAEFSAMFASPDPPDMDVALGVLGRAVDTSRCYIFAMEEGGRKMSNVNEWVKESVTPQIANLQNLDVSIVPWWNARIGAQEYIAIPDVSAMPLEAAAEKAIFEQQDIKSLLCVAIRHGDGRLAGFIGFDDTDKARKWHDEDIRLMKVAADILSAHFKRREMEKILRLLSVGVEQSNASIIMTDTQGRIVYGNKKTFEATGYSKAELMGQNPRLFKSGHTAPEEYKKLWDTITSGRVWRGEFHNKMKNGELYWESAVISPVRGTDAYPTTSPSRRT
ncbi:MAG: GAF domain-containing protein [Nitrospinae bacterium]|nr:GAF domain-containing protein [Nitrospinota bacterium]